ncbi:MAG: hypothetical protein H0X24_03435 [Ktedonobacterales bacterium]|nr:hypothetical protein [Ktedonobacterales bacterium]
MKLPEYASAIVPEQKIVGYLLSFSHPDGRGKALFFSRFGFVVAQWQVLADALRHHAAAHDVVASDQTPFGTRYVIEGAIVSPDGRNPSLRTVWFIAIGETIPRLVTAYPHP